MKRWIFAAVATWLTMFEGVAPIAAQPAPADTTRLATLEAMVQRALSENPMIAAAERRYRSLAAVPKQVSTLPDPMFGFTRWVKNVETRVGPQENVFVLSQRVPFPGKLGLMGRIKDKDAEAALQDLEAAKRDVAFKVKSAYADLYRIDRSLEILATYKRILEDFAAAAATRYATGKGIQAQVLKAQVEISAISVQELNFEKTRTGVVARLNALMNRPAEAPLPRVTQLALPELTLDDGALLELARSRRQELRAQQALIDQAGLARALARRNYLPDFNLQAMYISIPQVNQMFTDSGKDAFSIMVGLNLPIWLGKRRAAVDQASEMRLARQKKFENLWNQISAEITDLFFQLETLKQTLDLYKNGLLVQAESSLNSALSAYTTGRLDFLNLLDAERMLLNLRLAYTGQQAEYFKKFAALERAVGGRLENDVSRGDD